MIIEVVAPQRLQNITRQKYEDLDNSATSDKDKKGLIIIVSSSIILGYKGPLLV